MKLSLPKARALHGCMCLTMLLAVLASPSAKAFVPESQPSKDSSARPQPRRPDLFKMNGGISANGIFQRNRGGESDRLPFTYYFNGNLSVRIARLVDVGVTFSLTNAGGRFDYPTLPSRFSINPTYKWATAHIGNVTMIFSPYTLNGHLFTGVGVDLAPPGHWQVSAMYGRLQKATPYDSANVSAPAAYQRMGYGLKVGYRAERWRLGYIAFAARDNASSIGFVPDSLGIAPLQNVVMSLDGGVRIVRGLELVAEYANSAITGDRRDTAEVTSTGSHLLKPFISQRASTSYHKAIRSGLNYAINNTVLGVGYERVDPGYRTLGSYFFNNDLESYSLNAAQKLARGTLNLTGSLGYQIDNLAQTKSSTNRRTVGSLNASYAPDPRFYMNASYSNFLTYLNIKPQFRRINQLVPWETYDTLNYRQLSQNAMLNANWVVHKTDLMAHSLSTQLSFFDAADQSGGQGRTASSSRLYNGALSYGVQWVPSSISVNAGVNLTENQVGTGNYHTIGPLISSSGQFLKKTLQAQLSVSYNASTGSGVSSSRVLNSRIGLTYGIDKIQNLNAMLLSQQRTGGLQGHSSTLLATLGYNLLF